MQQELSCVSSGKFVDSRAADPACASALPDELAALYVTLATQHEEVGETDHAEQALRRALAHLERVPSKLPDDISRREPLVDAYAFFRLSVSFLRLGKAQEAERASRKAVEVCPQSPWAWNARGKVRLCVGQPDNAVSDFSKGIEVNPSDFASAWCYLGRSDAFRALKQEDRALADLNKAIELWPKLFDVWVWRGNFYLDQKHWDKAVTDFSRSLELNARYWDSWSRRGLANARLRQWDNAIRDYGKAVELNDKNPSLLNDLAWLLATCPDAKLRDPRRAVDTARKGVELAASWGQLWNTLGVAEYRAGNWPGALKALNKSIELRNGGDSHDWFFLAMAHRRLDKKDEARQWYDKAAEWMDKNRPKDDDLRRFRQEASELLGVKETKD
jgi:tetratricopeptide (TPR) repeat protein